MEPLISVIVPVYKVEKYLDRCIQSILCQTYRNLQIILVDDGSPDSCGAMCDSWTLKDHRIQAIHKPNGGLSDARNAGIRAATGEYVCFVDSDDYIAPEMISRLYEAAVNSRCLMAICNVHCVDEAGNSTGESDGSPIKTECLDYPEVLSRFYQRLGQFYIVAWNKLYHRSLLETETFPVGKWHEDEFVAAQLIWKARRIASVDYPGYCYVTQRPGSIMSAQGDVRRLDALEALLIRYRFYQQIGQTDLLHETRARVLRALEDYYWGSPSEDAAYHAKMEEIRRAYSELTDLSAKEWIKRMLFQIHPRLEYFLLRFRSQ